MMPEIRFENYQNDTLVLIQGEFLSTGSDFLYEIPAVGDSITAILVEGATQGASMPDYQEEGSPLIREREGGNPGGRSEPSADRPGRNAEGPAFAPHVCSYTGCDRRLLIPSTPQPLNPRLKILATHGTPVRFSILLHRADGTTMNWLESRQGCKKLSGFLLRASLAGLGTPAFELDGFLPDGALEKFCAALDGGVEHAPDPLRALLGPFSAKSIRQIHQTLGDLMAQIPRPYDHLLNDICQQFGACR